jgi:AcrR family transcriptional regulator
MFRSLESNSSNSSLDSPCKPPDSRRRSQRCHQAILQAAVELLEEKGYAAVTIEAIAARAGTGTQTIYRWWPSKAAVILEAYRVQAAYTVPDTGAVRTDLLQVLHQLFEVLNTTAGLAVTSLIAEAQLDANFAATFREQLINNCRDTLRLVLQHGVERGELQPDLDPELVIDAVYGPVWYRLLLKHAPLDQRFAEAVVNLLLGGLVRTNGLEQI